MTQIPEIVVDCFAGGGGASEGMERAMRRMGERDLLNGAEPMVSIAINHDDDALAMHAANHPDTLHLPVDIWGVDPQAAVNGNPVGLLWASPDCRHHSKAKGGAPVSDSVRDLAWVVTHWAEQVRPRIIMLENVEEFRKWGPTMPDGKGGKISDPTKRGETFNRWVARFKAMGYRVEWRELRACEFGTPTIRKRLYVIMRCDGQPIVWPEPTHGDPKSEAVKNGQKKAWPIAADIIDFNRPCPSILMDRAQAKIYKKETGTTIIRPLAHNTMARIAKGIKRYVLDAAEPFIVTCNHSGQGFRGQGFRGQGLDKPFATVTKARDAHGLVMPHVMTMRNSGKPFSTIMSGGTTQAVVAAHMLSLKGSNRRDGSVETPHPTVLAGGQHSAVVTMPLFNAYYGSEKHGATISEPMRTVSTRDRFGLVQCEGAGPQLTAARIFGAHAVANFLRKYGCWDGPDYVQVGDFIIYDIGMRMLTPRELARAQGFGDDYILAAPYKNKTLTETSQRHKIGNSVCPDMADALAFANYRPERRERYSVPQGWLFDGLTPQHMEAAE